MPVMCSGTETLDMLKEVVKTVTVWTLTASITIHCSGQFFKKYIFFFFTFSCFEC